MAAANENDAPARPMANESSAPTACSDASAAPSKVILPAAPTREMQAKKKPELDEIRVHICGTRSQRRARLSSSIRHSLTAASRSEASGTEKAARSSPSQDGPSTPARAARKGAIARASSHAESALRTSAGQNDVGATARPRRRRLATTHAAAVSAESAVSSTGQNGSFRVAASIRSMNGCFNSARVSFGSIFATSTAAMGF
jgi:hypothetical protein